MENQIPIAVVALMFGIGFIGVFVHWFKAACRKQAPWNLAKYLFVEQKGASGSMFLAYCIAMLGLYEFGTFDAVKIEYIKAAWDNGHLYKPFAAAALQTGTAGYLCDSAFNKPGNTGKERRAAFVDGLR